MSNAQLSFTNTGTRPRRRFHRNSLTGKTFNVPMVGSADESFTPHQPDEPQSGCLAHDTTLFTSLASLPDHSIHVRRPLRVVVQPVSGIYLASLVDTTISASGETPMEAVDSLGDIVAAKFRLFSREESVLGDHLRHQLNMLRGFLRAM